MEFLGSVFVAAVLFASTNIDDIFVLLGFFSDPAYRARQVIVGQYLGIAALVLASLLASLVSLVLEPAYVGLLGLLPVGIGVGKLVDLWRPVDWAEAAGGPRGDGFGKVLAGAGVTVANGGDNIGIYTPVFATSTAPMLVLFMAVFLVMVAIWLAFSHWLVNHPALGSPIRRLGRVATPFVLIALGGLVLHEAGSFALIV